jgi:hypothetical protein
VFAKSGDFGHLFGFAFNVSFFPVLFFSLLPHTGSILTNPSSRPSYHAQELHTQSLGAVTNPRFTGFPCMYSSFSIFFL